METKAASIVHITNGSGELLLLNRAYPPFGWGLPGGKQEDDEVAVECAMRELYEETGIILDMNKFVFVGKGLSSTGRELSIYKVEVGGKPDVVLSTEHSNYAWVQSTRGIALAGTTQIFIDMLK